MKISGKIFNIPLQMLLIFIYFLLLTISNSYSQSSAFAGVSATIVSPISISKVDDMSFGNIAPGIINSGTVSLFPNGTRASAGGVSLPPASGNVMAASFRVSGNNNCTYNITLPYGDFLISDGNGNSMVFNSFTSTPSTEGQLRSGEQLIKVGATLHVGANQVPGNYSNSMGFQVVVNYN